MDSNRLHHSKHCSNHSIEPHLGQLTSRWMGDHKSHTSHTQHHKGCKTCTTLMTTGLSKSTHPYKPNPKGTRWVFNLRNACNSVTRGRKHIGSTWSRNTCLAIPLAPAQGLLPCSLESSRTMKHLNNNDRKQAIQIINRNVHQTVSKY
jgi:hypothetical protein